MLNFFSKIIFFWCCLFFLNNAYSQQNQDQNTQDLIRQQDWLTRQQQHKIDDNKMIQEQESVRKKIKINDLDWENNQFKNSKTKEENCFILKKINVINGKIFKPKDHSALLNQYLGRCFTKELAYELVEKIQLWYKNKGYIATQVYIPVQNIKNQELSIKIDEGEISEIILNDNQLSDKIQKFSAFGFIKNKPLNIKDINQGLLQINRLTSSSATLKIQPGKKEGQTKLVIKNIKKKPLKFSIGHDNLGAEFTGVKRTN